MKTNSYEALENQPFIKKLKSQKISVEKEVKSIQIQLEILKYYDGIIDKKFGDSTKLAV